MKKPNPFAYGKPITLDTLGDLFSHHRGHLGGWSMEDDPPAGDPPAGDPPAGDPPAFAPITSQADLDKVLGQRLQREREKFPDYAELKRKAAEHDAAVEAARTDAEKAVDAARKEGEEAGRKVANTQLIQAEARAVAAELRFAQPALAVRATDLSTVAVKDDGSVDTEAIKAALTATKDSGAFVIDDGKKPGPRPDHSQGGGGGATTPSVSSGRDLFASRRKKAPADS